MQFQLKKRKHHKVLLTIMTINLFLHQQLQLHQLGPAAGYQQSNNAFRIQSVNTVVPQRQARPSKS